MADDYKKIEESFLGARNYANELADILGKAGKNTKAANEFASKLADNLKSQTSAADKLNAAVEARKDYIEETVKSGKFLNKGLLAQLDSQIKLLEIEKKIDVELQKQVDKAKEYEDLLKDQNDKLKESLGILIRTCRLVYGRWCNGSWCKSIY
jgi:ATP-dependent Lon protease